MSLSMGGMSSCSVRCVVRNNFFGLESTPQNQKGIKDKVTPAIPTGEHEGRQEKPSEEARAVPRFTSLVDGERSSAEVSNQEDLEKSMLLELTCTCICAQNNQRILLTGTDQISSISISVDEIWESPSAVMT